MDVIVLPQDLPLTTKASLQLFNYRTQEHLQRSKINLTKNTISFLRTGTKELIGGHAKAVIDHRQFVLMKSGHCLMSERLSPEARAYQSILLFFPNELVIDFLERHRLPSQRTTPDQSFYVFNYDAYLQHFVESLEKMLTLPARIQQPLLKAKFEEIMLYLTDQHGATFLHQFIQDTDNTVSHLIRTVENNRLNKLSLQELAFLCNMSISTFKREFFKQYQVTPMRWFLQARLTHVALLLRTHNKRPIDLYEVAGYESFSNFVQAFKKQYGLTPKQYQSQD